MKLRQLICSVIAGGALASTATAGAVILEETQQAPFDFPLSPGQSIVPVGQFDSQGGNRQLMSVRLELDGVVSAQVTAENDAPIPAPDFSLTLAGFMTGDVQDLSTLVGFSQSFSTPGVAASDGVPGSGPDFWNFGLVSAAGSDDDTTSSNLAPYIGTGTVNADVFATGGFSITGSTDSTITTQNFRATGVVRVVYTYELLVVPGACCLPNGSCAVLEEQDCIDQGGNYQGDLTICDQTVDCPPAIGACCLLDGTCQDGMTQTECTDANGFYQGDATLCNQVICPEPKGACCLPGEECTVVSEASCAAQGGEYTADGVICPEVVCIDDDGACCLTSGACVDGVDLVGCLLQGGSFQGEGTDCGSVQCPAGKDRANASEKGSLVIFSKVEVRWGSADFLVQDTFLSLTNDHQNDVRVQMYFINGDAPLDAVYDENGVLIERAHPGWNWVDNEIELTGNEPTYWSAATGQPKGVSPWTVLDPGTPKGRPANDGTGERMLRGFVLAWAVNADNQQIRWNHLAGNGTLVSYIKRSAWEYGGASFRVVDTTIPHGDQVGTPGILKLDGFEYARAADFLLMNFQAAGAAAFSGAGTVVISDTDVTLHPVSADLRQTNDGPVTTKANLDIWNQNEVKFSGAHRCITCWDQELISKYDSIPNHFLRPFLQTDHGKTRIDGHAAPQCNELDDPDTPEDESVTSVAAAMLGLNARHLVFDGGSRYDAAGGNMVGMGFQSAEIRYDVLEDIPEAEELVLPAQPTRDDLVRFIDRLIRLDDRSVTNRSR